MKSPSTPIAFGESMAARRSGTRRLCATVLTVAGMMTGAACGTSAPPSSSPDPSPWPAPAPMGDAATNRAAIDSVVADGIVPRLLARLDEQAEADDLRPARDHVIGVLDWNTTTDVPVTLVAESEYVIQGVCDADCRNLDLRLMDPAGRTIWTKEYADTSPEIRGTAPGSGTYVVRVLMRACASPRCGFGLAVYTNAPDEEG